MNEPSPRELAIACSALSTEKQNEVLVAIDILRDIADRDCWCECPSYKDGDLDPALNCDPVHKCEPCIARDAIQHLQEAAYPQVRSLREERLSGAERVYFDCWAEKNVRTRKENGLLEILLGFNGRPAVLSQRDLDVATTVVQWLGTNVGRCFVSECERQCDIRRAETTDYEYQIKHGCIKFEQHRNKNIMEKIADRIATNYGRTDQNRKALYGEILNAMLWARRDAYEEYDQVNSSEVQADVVSE